MFPLLRGKYRLILLLLEFIFFNYQPFQQEARFELIDRRNNITEITVSDIINQNKFIKILKTYNIINYFVGSNDIFISIVTFTIFMMFINFRNDFRNVSILGHLYQ
jgi:hypothetical protein